MPRRRRAKKKGPGKFFRKGLTLPEIIRLFPDHPTAEKWFAQVRWPSGPWCPFCGSVNVQEGAAHPNQPYRCRDCIKRFSVRTKTVMADSKIGFQGWALALYLMTTGIKGTSSMKLHRDLGITQESAWFLAHRIRTTWSPGDSTLAGPIEADETFIGGKEGNKHESQKLRAGHGTVGKIAVAGIKDRATNEVRAKVVGTANTENVQEFVGKFVDEEAKLYTDESAIYNGMPNHTTLNHSVGEYVDGQAHTNGIESFWSLLKRGYQGTFHHMSAKHLHRYVDEFAGRHNARNSDTLMQMYYMARGMLGRRLTYKKLTERE